MHSRRKAMKCNHEHKAHFGTENGEIVVCVRCEEQIGGKKVRRMQLDLFLAKLFKNRAGLKPLLKARNL